MREKLNSSENIYPDDRLVVGLKIDVDTFRGTEDGVPGLLKVMRDRKVKGSFFFSLGPDNMGRHLWRLLRPAFLKKMLRGNAVKLYGMDILLKGTVWPGPDIGRYLRDTMRQAMDDGHEVGLHSYDHYLWQTHLAKARPDRLASQMGKATAAFERVFGTLPTISANPGWQLSKEWLEAKDGEPWLYHSDCRGRRAGLPVLDGKVFKTLQIPTTIPTFDEVIGRSGVTESNYNSQLINRLRPGKLNVLTVHAEVEGIAYASLFDDFLDASARAGVAIVPLRDIHQSLLAQGPLPELNVKFDAIPGREGSLAILG